MSLKIIPTNVCYKLRQQVDIAERETDRSPVVKEQYERVGLIFLQARVDDARWHRSLEEYILSQEVLQKIPGSISIPRSELRQSHKQFNRKQKLRFGLDIPMEVETDLRNKDVGIPFDSAPLPIGYDALYLPTILPEFPPGGLQPGQSWKAKVRVLFGAGTFELSYSAKFEGVYQGNWRVSLLFEAQDSTFREKGFVLTMRPEGTCSFDVGGADGAPVNGSGEVRIKARGRKEIEGEIPSEAELLNCRYKFDWARVPVSFDQKQIHATAWH